MNYFKKLYLKKISGTGLGIFRIVFGIVYLGEIIQMFWFRHLIYDKIPYLSPAEIDFSIPIFIWGVSVVLLTLGLFTNYAKIINYLLTIILIGSIKTYEYHMFYVYIGISFIMLFLPISQNLSLDRLLIKLKYSNTTFNYIPPKKVSVINYLLPIFVAIALVYFDSIFFKTTSNFWKKGLGVWLPSSVPNVANSNLTWLLNNEILVKTLSWLTIAFETIFIFTFFRKKWRLPLLIIGMGLHLGILVAYPIPWFALGMTALYLLMVPVSFWEKIKTYLTKKTPSMIFYYDMECPLCNRTKIIIQHFDIRNAISFETVQFDAEKNNLLKGYTKDELLDNIHSIKKEKVYVGVDTYIQVLNAIFFLAPISWVLRIPGIYHICKRIYAFVANNRNTERCTEDTCGYTIPSLPSKPKDIKILKTLTLEDLQIKFSYLGIIALIILQVVISYNSPLNKTVRNKMGIQNSVLNKRIENISKKLEQQTKIYLGIAKHGVFMDYHFSEYNHDLAITYKTKTGEEEWLPIIDKKGMPDNYLLGPIWAKWSFRTNHNKINQKQLETGIRDFTAFWANKNNINLNDATFYIKLKKIDTPKNWEKDFLEKQIQKPWKTIGKVEWKNNQYHINIPKVEKL